MTRALKIAFVINNLVYVAFSIVIHNYVAIVTNTVVAVTTTIALIKEQNDKKDKQEE